MLQSRWVLITELWYYEQFDDAGQMRPRPFYDRVVDVMEELVRFTWLTRDQAGYLVDRYSERVATTGGWSGPVARGHAAATPAP